MGEFRKRPPGGMGVHPSGHLRVPPPPGSLEVAGLADSLVRLLRLACRRVLRWHELARERRALLDLDDRLLRDIGLTRADALRESLRRFWDDPRA